MKYILPLLLIFRLAFAQQPKPTDCNTIFLCVDPETYQNIFLNSFIKDTLFVCRESSTKTNIDSYQAKYLIGKSATIELFQPQETGKFGDQLGDFGLEFKTRQIGEQQKLIRLAQQKGIVLTTENIKLQDSIPWYTSVKLTKNQTNLELSNIEYQNQYLAYLGFTGDQIKQEMTFEDFNKKMSKGRNYPRAFSNFESISIRINKKDFKYLEDFCLLHQMKKTKNAFKGNGFSIYYNFDAQMNSVAIINLKFKLIHTYPDKKINLSSHVVLQIHRNSGIFLFQ